MNKNKRLQHCIFIIILVVTVVMTGCDNIKKVETQTHKLPTDAVQSKLKEVTLVYYLVNSPQSDIQTVNDAMNKLIKEKINATVKLNLVDWGSYDQKMSLIMASGEPYDLCFTSTWTNNYYQNVANGAYIPLDDFLVKYGTNVLKNVPQRFWSAARVGGKIYAAINFQQAAAGFGIEVQTILADKYDLDWQNVKSLADCTSFLEKIKRNEPKLIPFGYNKNLDPFIRGTIMHGMEAIGDVFSPGWIYLKDSDMRIVNQYDTPEFRQQCKLMRDWYLKGFIRKDAATLKDVVVDQKTGKMAMEFGQIDLDNIDFKNQGLSFKGRMSAESGGKIQSYDKKFVEPVLTTEKAAAAMTAISTTSKNPERAMMLIDLFNSDKQIFNTVLWGIEGRHYNKSKKQNMIDVNEEAGYVTYSPWLFGYQGNGFLSSTNWSEGSGEEVNGVPKGHRMWIDLNTKAKESPTFGFVFDYEPVKAEIAKCKAVTDQMYFAVASGSVDPDKYIPMFNNQLKLVGMDRIIAEKQKQIDAWRTAK